MTHVYYVRGEVRYYDPPSSNLGVWLSAWDYHGYKHLPSPRNLLAGQLRIIRKRFGAAAAVEFARRMRDQESWPAK